MHVELKSPIAPIPRASSPRPAQNLPVKRPASLSTGASHSGTPDFQPKPDPPHPDHNIYHERRRPLVTTLGWDINAIIASSPNFHRMGRVHYSSPAASIGINEYEKDGVPLIIQGWHRHPRWPKSMFNVEWLQKNGDQNPTVRNVHNWTDFKITIEEFIQKLRNGSPYASADEQERLYGKDGECPAAWTEWLTEDHVIPKELLFDGSNDFLKFLPDTAKVQTLMCYVGIGDTFTPFHKDLCGSSGQNLMCYTEHSGSSFWFMTKASAAPQVTAYFHQLGQELDLETHVVTIEELARAPFDVYIAEQQTGDLVLVPPRSCHQVVNKGGITIKTSWSRMSLDGLQTALWHELPIYHRVCRQEIYKVKSIIFHAVQHFTSVLENPPANSTERDTIASAEQLKQLVVLFDDVLASDYSTTRDSMPHVSQSGSIHKDDLHCDFCGADVFQSFFECDSCTPMPSSEASGILAVGDGLVLCPLCYVEGRTCRCGETQPVQCRPFSDLLETRDRAVRAIQPVDNNFATAYGPLSEQPSRLLSERTAGVFEAACKLFQQRQSAIVTTRSCRARSKVLSHQVPITAAIYCKYCHSSKCYTHLLEVDFIHSITAIFTFDRHDAKAAWHQFHRNSSKEYEDLQQRAIKDEEMGTRPDTLHRLTYLAKAFTTCRAIAPELTKHGWYDRYAQTSVIPIVTSPARVLVGLPEAVEGDESCASEVSGNAHATGSSKQGSVSRGGSLRRSVSRSASKPASVAPATSPRAITERVIAEVPPSCQSSILPVPNSLTPILDSQSISLGVAARQTPKHASLAEFCSSPVIRKPSSLASVQSPVADDTGSSSDLTDLPTEFNSSPLVPIVDVNLMSVVPDSEASNPPTPTKPSIFLPAVSATSSPPFRPLAKLKTRQRLVLDCVEIQPPEWYEKMRAETQAVSVSSSQGKRKQSEVLLSEDDMPVEQLPRRYPAPQSALRRRPGPFPRVSSPLSSGVVETSGPSNPSISYKSLPIKQPPPSQPSSPRKRKISQSAVSRLPPPRKRIRSSRFDLDPPVEALGTNILASALNQTFQCNSTSGSRHAPTTPVTTSGVALVNNALSIPKPLCAEPQYKDIAIQTGLNFTRQTFELALMVDQSSYIATLEEQQRVLQAALEASERRCQSLQESLEEISRRYVQVAGSQPHVTTLLPSTSTSHSVSRPQRQVQHITPDNQLHPIHAQEPEHPPIETLRPLTPPWQEGSWRLPDSISTPAPPRRTTPTEPHSSGQRVAVQQERGRGNVQQGSREQYRHGSKKHSQRGSNFGTASKGRGRGRGRPRPPSPPPTQSVRPTDGPIPSSSLSIIEAKSSYPLSPTATVHSATMVQGRGGPKDHMLPSSANDKQPPLEGPKAEES